MNLRNVVLVLVAAAAVLPAQAPPKVTGTVVDTSGNPVVDLKVTITNQATDVSREVRTQPDGSYEVQGEPGKAMVSIEKAGRGMFGVRDVELAPGDVKRVNFTLSAKNENQNLLYMFYGFVAAWLVLMIYVITLVARERGLRKKIETLRRMVESESR